MYRYIHSDVWRGVKYYTTLNTAIISIGFSAIATLLTINAIVKASFLAIIPIFVMGVCASLFAILSVRQHRVAFLNVIWFKTIVEEALKGKLGKVLADSKVEKKSKFWRLTPVYSLPDEDHNSLLSCKDLWIKSNIFRKKGIVYYFKLFQIVFLLVNISGIVVAVILSLF
jgi:hypothetical protein